MGINFEDIYSLYNQKEWLWYEKEFILQMRKVKRLYRQKDIKQFMSMYTVLKTLSKRYGWYDIDKKFGINKLISKIWKHRMHMNPNLIFIKTENLNKRWYPESVISKLFAENKVGFTDMGDKSHPDTKEEVGKLMENLVKWREFIGETEEPRMVYRGGGYEPY